MPGTAPTSDEAFARRLLAWRPVLYAISLLAAVSCTALYLQFTADDAFISFRYGLNLVAHRTWNWNPYGPREEAYTSAVYTALSAVPALLHLSQPLFFKLLGAACVAAMALRARTFAASPFAAALGVLVLAVHPFVWIHAYSGLETPLYMLLILELALAAHRAAEASPAWVYSLALLLPLTRPEGLLFACAGVCLFWLHRSLLQDEGKPAPKQLALFAAAVSTGTVYFLLRWRYFHRLFPNPASVKLQPASLHVLLNNLFDNLYQSEWYFFTVLAVFLLGKTGRPASSLSSASPLCSSSSRCTRWP
jgi:hypothetical protein